MQLSDLLKYDEDLKMEFLDIRGLTRTRGILSKTPAHVIDAGQEYYRRVSVAMPGKYDFVVVDGEKIRKRQLSGLFQTHHRAFVKQEKKTQQKEWKETQLITEANPASGASMYACSTLLSHPGDATFYIVSVVGAVTQYSSNLHQPMRVKRKLVMPKKIQRKEAYQAVLKQQGNDDTYAEKDVCSIEEGEDVVIVGVHPWGNRQKGAFTPAVAAGIGARRVVVPAHLVRFEVNAEKVKEMRIDREHMKDLYHECKAFHVSYGKFYALKPKEVVLSKREGCYCGYHLRYEYQVHGLKRYVRFLKKTGKITEEQCDEYSILLGDPRSLRLALTCAREDAQEEYSHHKCLTGHCEGCGEFSNLIDFFGGISEHIIPFAIEDITKRDFRIEKYQELDESEEATGNSSGMITYPRMVKTIQKRKDKTEKTQKEFLSRTVTLKEFWGDFLGFFHEFNVHHDGAKRQGREFAHLKGWEYDADSGEYVANLPRGHVRMVIDYLQRHTLKRGSKQTQQEYFSQMGMTLCVVSLTFHLDELENISAEDKGALKAGFKAQKRPPLIREEHFYCSHDPERGQPAVQYILQDVKDYLESDGRWAAAREECTEARRKAYDYNNSRGGETSAYYRGRGAGKRGKFAGVDAWSDGCSADFKCATLLLFLSSMPLSFGQMWTWNWFFSCHGKTDECDAGGGALKGKLDSDEMSSLTSGEGFHDRALGIVRSCRKNLATPGKWERTEQEGEEENDVAAYFKKGDGSGVWRRWYHHIPVGGKGSINRKIPEAKLAKESGKGGNISREDDPTVSFPVSKIHRAVAQGFSTCLKVSTRSCYSCGKCKVGDIANCENSKEDKESGKPWLDGQCSRELVSVVIDAKSEQPCQYTSSPAIEIASEVYAKAKQGHVLAAESQSEVEPMWLVRVVKKHSALEEDQKFSNWGVEYCCEAGKGALEVTRLFISSSKATNTFCDDVKNRTFFIPTIFLRHSDLSGDMEKKDNTIQTDGSNRTWAAVEVTGDGTEEEQPKHYYELDADKRRKVALLCREYA